jgi:hypothetical protein
VLGSEKRQLILRLYPFRHHLQPQTVRHGDDGAGNFHVAGVGGDIANERTIHFEDVDRKAFEVGKR